MLLIDCGFDVSSNNLFCMCYMVFLFYMFFLPDETQRRVEDGAGVRGAMLQVG